jgi:hypothetical protein
MSCNTGPLASIMRLLLRQQRRQVLLESVRPVTWQLRLFFRLTWGVTYCCRCATEWYVCDSCGSSWTWCGRKSHAHLLLPPPFFPSSSSRSNLRRTLTPSSLVTALACPMLPLAAPAWHPPRPPPPASNAAKPLQQQQGVASTGMTPPRSAAAASATITTTFRPQPQRLPLQPQLRRRAITATTNQRRVLARLLLLGAGLLMPRLLLRQPLAALALGEVEAEEEGRTSAPHLKKRTTKSLKQRSLLRQRRWQRRFPGASKRSSSSFTRSSC